MKRKTWIQRKRGVQGGRPCLRGTRIPVETIKRVAREWSILRIMREYPTARLEAIVAAMRYRDRARKKGPSQCFAWHRWAVVEGAFLETFVSESAALGRFELRKAGGWPCKLVRVVSRATVHGESK